MTIDYRDALELTELTKTPALNQAQKAMILETIPVDRFISAQELIEKLLHKGVTRLQVLRRLKVEFEDGTIIKIPQMLDNRRKLYRRNGVMD